ncbi:MAG: sigma factor [Myxococcota bacterium]
MEAATPDREYRLLMESQDWKSLCARVVRFAAKYLQVTDLQALVFGKTAEELGLEAVEKVASGQARWDPSRGASLETYLYEVTKNVVLSHIRDNKKRASVGIEPREGENHDEAFARAVDSALEPSTAGPRPEKAWAEQVVNRLLADVARLPVLGPMVEHMYETGETKRSRIAAHLHVSADDVTNATKRLRRVTEEIVSELQDMEGAVRFRTNTPDRRPT